MKKRVSLLLLATGLFIGGATLSAKAGDEKCSTKKETASCCKKKAETKCDSEKKEAEKK